MKLEGAGYRVGKEPRKEHRLATKKKQEIRFRDLSLCLCLCVSVCLCLSLLSFLSYLVMGVKQGKGTEGQEKEEPTKQLRPATLHLLDKGILICSEAIFWFGQEVSSLGVSQQYADSSRELDQHTASIKNPGTKGLSNLTRGHILWT